jgi:hypothetical protein
MKIKFLSDFRGRETNEQFYQAGEVVELPLETAERLINDGRAERVEIEEPAKPAKKGKVQK